MHNSTTATPLIDLLLAFLVDKLPCLDESSKISYNTAIEVEGSVESEPVLTASSMYSQRVQQLLHLFRFCFAVVSSVQATAEVKSPELHTILKHYLVQIIEGCLKLSSSVIQPWPYCQILRLLFRCISASNSELMHKDIVALIPNIVSSCIKLHYRGPLSVRDSSLEVLFTIPTRPQIMLPYLPSILPVVLRALAGTDEANIKNALRLLERWIEVFNPEYVFLCKYFVL